MIEKALKKIFVVNQNTPMSQTQFDALTAFANSNDVSRADVMRTALAMYLEIHGDKQ